MARGVRFLLGFRQYPFLKKNGPGIPVFGYCPIFKYQVAVGALSDGRTPEKTKVVDKRIDHMELCALRAA